MFFSGSPEQRAVKRLCLDVHTEERDVTAPYAGCHMPLHSGSRSKSKLLQQTLQPESQ